MIDICILCSYYIILYCQVQKQKRKRKGCLTEFWIHLYDNPWIIHEYPCVCWEDSSNKKNKLYGLFFFYGWGSTASRLEPLQGGSLLFTTKFPEILVLILSTSEGWKAELTLEPPTGFEHGSPGLGIQRNILNLLSVGNKDIKTRF